MARSGANSTTPIWTILICRRPSSHTSPFFHGTNCRQMRKASILDAAPGVGHISWRHGWDFSTASIPSTAALDVARRNLQMHPNCSFHCASVEAIPLADSSADFGYSLGVLHHVPDTQRGITECARKLKPGAPLLIYLYYAFDNRPRWFQMLWRISDWIRRRISALPFSIRSPLCDTVCSIRLLAARTHREIA